MDIEQEKRNYGMMLVTENSMSIDIRLNVPGSAYAAWQGLKAAHGLDEGFLEFVFSRMFVFTVMDSMRQTHFAE